MNVFDIFIAYIEWGDNGKRRPVLILGRDGETLFIFNITTQYESKPEKIRAKYFKITDWEQAGLDKQSYVDTNTVRELPSVALEGKTAIGRLSADDERRLIEFIG